MDRYEVGKKIKDPAGFVWLIINIWEFEDHKNDKHYLCLALIGVEGNKSAGQMGGKRFEVELVAKA